MGYWGTEITKSRIDSTLNKSMYEMEDLVELFLFLSQPNKRGVEIAQIISDVMDSLTLKKLVALDKMFRSKTSFRDGGDWRKVSIRQIISNAASIRVKVNLLALGTFHPVGYFREKALDELIKCIDSKSIPFLIIRTNDWVEIIREKSKSALLRIIDMKHFVSLMKHYNLITHSKNYTYGIHDRIVEKLNKLTVNLTSDEIISAIRTGDEKGKIYCYKILAQRQIIKVKALFDLIQKEKSPFVRERAFDALINHSHLDELISHRNMLFSANTPSTREKLITTLFQGGFYNSHESLETALLDKSAMVRETAVYYMKKIGDFDFLNFYKHKLTTQPNSYALLCGVFEHGSMREEELAKESLFSTRQKIIKAALSFLAKVNFEKHLEIITEGLQDVRKGISNHARNIMIMNKRNVIYSDVFSVFAVSNNITVRKNCMLILKRASKWEALIYLLEFIADKDQEISEIGERYYHDWKKKLNRSFLPPSKNQIDRINKLLRENIDNMVIDNQIKFALNEN